jgi:transcriptional regulator with XRE-family HTH domain
MRPNPIVDYRKAKGLTQADLARALGVNVNSVQGWERGSEPRPKLVPKLAEALGMDARQLLVDLRAWREERQASQGDE